MNMWPIPNPDELITLPMRRKGDWEGAGWLLFALVWIMRFSTAIAAAACLAAYSIGLSRWIVYSLGAMMIPTPLLSKLSRQFMTRFHTYWFGTIWYAQGSLPKTVEKFIMEHESLHHWQRQNIRMFALKYICPWPYWRRHAEASAYALDVWRGKRSLASAAASMRHPMYAMFLSRDKSEMMIEAYVKAWKLND